MGFPTVYETTILSKFWANQEVEGAGKKNVGFKTLSQCLDSTVYSMMAYA